MSASSLSSQPTRASLPSRGLRTITTFRPTGEDVWTGREKLVVFASEWYFSKEGAKEVEARFTSWAKLCKVVAKLTWEKEDATFRIVCTENPEFLYREFVQIIRRVVKDCGLDGYMSGLDSSDEGTDSDDDTSRGSDTGEEDKQPFKGKKYITRLSKHRKGVSGPGENGDETTDVVKWAVGSTGADTPEGADDDYPLELNGSKAKGSWQYSGPYSLDEIISAPNLVQLERLTGCKCLKDLNRQIIFLGAEAMTVVQLAQSKLENMKKQAESPIHNSHVLYTEGLEDVKFQIKYFTSVKEGFFKTTMLDTLQLCGSNNYENMSFAATVRRADYNAQTSEYVVKKVATIIPATAEATLHEPSRIWEAPGRPFTYCPKGSEDPATKIRAYSPGSADGDVIYAPPVLPESTESIVMNWVDKVPSALPLEIPPGLPVPDNPDPLIETQNIPKQSAKESWDLVDDYVVEERKKKTKTMPKESYRAPKLDAKVLKTIANRAPAPVASRSANMPPAFSEHASRSQRQKSLMDDDIEPLPAFSETASRSQRQKSLMDDDIEPPPAFSETASRSQRQQSLMNDDIEPPPAFSETVSRSQRQQSLMDDDALPLELSHAALQSTPSRTSPANDGDLINLDTEAMQANDEVSSRRYYQTNSLLAPKPKKNAKIKANPFAGRLEGPEPIKPRASLKPKPTVIDPLPEFLTQMNHGFDALLKKARGFQGDVKVFAEFGRIIIKNVHDKHMDIDKDSDKLTHLLELGPLSFWTNQLSQFPGDMHYMVEMPDANGQRMWRVEDPSLKWSVVYEFHCSNRNVPGFHPFIIEIDGETFAPRSYVKHDLGNVNVHGTKRHWDFRLTAVGLEDGADESYDVLAKQIASSLYIAPNQTCVPEIKFEVESPLIADSIDSAGFAIHYIHVHRIEEYMSTDNKSTLKISTVQELPFSMTPIEKGTTIYQATTLEFASRDHNPMINRRSFWHQASISSVEADAKFEENKTLELGDLPSWTPESLAGAAPAIYLPACKMLKGMDGVGYWNDNNVDPNAPVGYVETDPDAQRPTYSFW